MRDLSTFPMRWAARLLGGWAVVVTIYLALVLHYLRIVGPYIVDDAFIFFPLSARIRDEPFVKRA